MAAFVCKETGHCAFVRHFGSSLSTQAHSLKSNMEAISLKYVSGDGATCVDEAYLASLRKQMAGINQWAFPGPVISVKALKGKLVVEWETSACTDRFHFDKAQLVFVAKK